MGMLGFLKRSSALSQQIELAQLKIGEIILTCHKTFNCIKLKLNSMPIASQFQMRSLHNTDFSIVPVYMALTQGIESHMQHVHFK